MGVGINATLLGLMLCRCMHCAGSQAVWGYHHSSHWHDPDMLNCWCWTHVATLSCED